MPGCWCIQVQLAHQAAQRDRLWLVGDLVNRGPRSLEVLRWARRMEDRVTAVLGNHDLHLLGRAYGLRPEKAKDTLDDVLRARDSFELVNWLRQRPLRRLARPGAQLVLAQRATSMAAAVEWAVWPLRLVPL